MKLLVASSNPGKLREYRSLCAEHSPGISVELLPGFAEIATFEESASTFAENAAGKALYYSRFAEMPVLADDSGLAVAALVGAEVAILAVNLQLSRMETVRVRDRLHRFIALMIARQPEHRRPRRQQHATEQHADPEHDR